MKTFKRILKYTKSYRILMGFSIFASIIYATLNSISIWLIGTMLGNIMGSNSELIENPESLNEYLNYFIQNLIGSGNALSQLKNLCILLIIIFISKNILFYVSKLIMSYVQHNVITNIRIKLFKHISTLSLSFFNNTKVAEISSILIRDIAGMRVAFSQTLQKIIVEPISILSFIILLFIINVEFTLIVLTIIPLCGFFSYKIGQSIRRKAKRSSIQIADILNIIKESLTNIKIIKIFNLEKIENEKFYKENQKYFSLMFRQSKISSLLTPINEIIGLIVGILLIWIGGTNVLQEGTMNPDDFIKFILLLFAMLQPIRKLANINVIFQGGIASAERVFEIFDNNERIKQEPNSIKIEKFNSEIRFNEIQFKYNNERTILNGINTKIKKGETTAIIGKSGSGKSTFLDLIPRFYDVTNGEILIDNINIKKYKLKDLRNLFGVVTQNVILFNDTIKNNILYGNKNATNEEILNAIESSNLNNLIEKLPKGLNTIIGENGVKLSGGEKQRVSIARAIIKNPEILILDEATASLDSESEKKVHQAIDNIIKNRTVIIIAHRLSTIINANKILVIKNGKIIEEGTHSELSKKNGEYKKLYELQFKK
tara:strand:+ start:632 stop:2434 length:1803 start_codon:yes stop_codon:yes gene_type:complete